MERKLLKDRAKDLCSLNWSKLVLATLIYGVIYLALTSISSRYKGVSSYIINFIILFIGIVYIKYLIMYKVKNSHVDAKDFMINLKVIWNYIKFRILMTIFLIPAIIIYYLALPFIIASIYAPFIILLIIVCAILIICYILWLELTYFLVKYMIAESMEDLKILKCMSLSHEMMKGHRDDLIILFISFLGWIILSILTFGIGFLWLLPYMNLTLIEFYYKVSGKDDSTNN